MTDNLDKFEPAPEYEIVVGRRQIYSLTFLVVVLLATAAGGAYLVGKASNDRVMAAAPPPPVKTEAPVTAPEPAPAPAPEEVLTQKPLYDTPIKGVVYIQMGAVEQGIAEILAEGLRTRGFDSFIAPGPSQKIFRVLIGPFKNAEDYSATRKTLDDMHLETFARKYEE